MDPSTPPKALTTTSSTNLTLTPSPSAPMSPPAPRFQILSTPASPLFPRPRSNYYPQRRSSLNIWRPIDDGDIPEYTPLSRAQERIAENRRDRQRHSSRLLSLGQVPRLAPPSSSFSSTGFLDVLPYTNFIRSSSQTHTLRTITKEQRLDERFRIPFNIEETKPLHHPTHKWRLTAPCDVEDFAIALLHQRWYQTLGGPFLTPTPILFHLLLKGIATLKEDLRHGGEGCSIQKSKFFLHRAMCDNLAEINQEWAAIQTGTVASRARNEDGSWLTPSVIVPEILEFLPLEYEDRKRLHKVLEEKWTWLRRELRVGGKMSEREAEPRRWVTERNCVRSFIDDVAEISKEVGVLMKQHLKDLQDPYKIAARELDAKIEARQSRESRGLVRSPATNRLSLQAGSDENASSPSLGRQRYSMLAEKDLYKNGGEQKERSEQGDGDDDTAVYDSDTDEEDESTLPMRKIRHIRTRI